MGAEDTTHKALSGREGGREGGKEGEKEDGMGLTPPCPCDRSERSQARSS